MEKWKKLNKLLMKLELWFMNINRKLINIHTHVAHKSGEKKVYFASI